MISRKTSIALAEIYADVFKDSVMPGFLSANDKRFITTDSDKLFDFLYSEDYEAWFCNLIRKQKEVVGTRPLKDFIMKLQTGESLTTAANGWSWEDRERLGQKYLQDLAEDILIFIDGMEDYARRPHKKSRENLIRLLELDGYLFTDSKLLVPDEGVLNVEEEMSVLQEIYSSLGLAEKETAFHHLNLSQEHYLDGKWDDSISNSRKFLECVLQEVAAAHHLKSKDRNLALSKYKSPYKVRDYLQESTLLAKKEKEAIAKIYGVLSETGGHPYMAERDQARLLRNLSLTLSQFVMLRYRGFTEAA